MPQMTRTNSRHPNPHRLRFRSGNAILDMALVLPLLIGLTFGAVEYGYALYIKHSLQAAARWAVRSSDKSSITSTTPRASLELPRNAVAVKATGTGLPLRPRVS